MKFRISLLAAAALIAGGCSNHASPPIAADSGVARAAHATPMHVFAAARQDLSGRFGREPDRGALVRYPAQPVVRREGAYTLHRVDLSEAHARDAIGGVLTVPLPDGRQLQYRYARHVEHPNGDWTWIGSVPGQPGREAILTFGDKAAFGTLDQGEGPSIRLTEQNGSAWLMETDPRVLATVVNQATRPTRRDAFVPSAAALASAAHDAPQSGTAPPSAALTSTATSSNTVDVVVGYTNGFAASFTGGESAAQTRINFLVDATNEAYVTSGIDGQVRVVKMMSVSYTDANSNDTALNELTGYSGSTRTTPNAAFNALRAARDQYGADLVSLVRKFNEPENGGCGVAWINGGGKQGKFPSGSDYFGYSVVSDGKDAGADGQTYYCRDETFAHELGHNMGAAHDVATMQGSDGVLQTGEYGVFDYSFGYKSDTTHGNFYTVMAYGDSGQNDDRVFSNPRLSICGPSNAANHKPVGSFACGTSNTDNARTLSQTFAWVAAFRATVVPLPAPPPAVRRTPADIDGDGRSDLLLQNAGSGLVSYWTMSGATPTRYSDVFIAPTGYARAATGDFNGDGKLDIVWARATDGNLVLWTGNGTGFTSAVIRNVAPGWAVVAAGDIDGDGRSDLLLQNAGSGLVSYWTMSGATPTRYSDVFIAPTGYARAATGDFNGDGKLDIVWARATDGNLVLWTGNGTGFTSAVIRNVAPGWAVVAAGDIDGDGRSDLLLQNAGSGLVSYWTMSGATPTRYSDVFIAPTGYARAATGDFNGDGKLDIVWARATDGNLVLWTGNGTGFTSAVIRNVAPGWAVVNP